jgi:hypothetical protein
MMDAEEGRSQTTKGIWLDVSSKVTEQPTLVMDLEGSDGRERGEDDTAFERQSALFALASADILMINMFAVNIGRVQGSGAPLLKTVLQVRPLSARSVLIFTQLDSNLSVPTFRSSLSTRSSGGNPYIVVTSYAGQFEAVPDCTR